MPLEPQFAGRPVEIGYRRHLVDTAGNPAHAATYLRDRLILLDAELRTNPAEYERILLHELFHFVWVRLGNPVRREWEDLLRTEREAGVRGEAGWSAEWRKNELRPPDPALRTRRWREYNCEAFCDTAALACGAASTEVTLAARHLRARCRWFELQFAGSPLPI